MAKQYFVWKDPACNGENIEWLELTGKAFYDLLKQDENKERKFIRMGNDICPEADIVYIEATEAQYREWYTEYCHHKYLCTLSRERTALSLDMLSDGEELCPLYELIANLDAEYEEDVLRKSCAEQLPAAMMAMTPLRREAIELKYFTYPGKSDAELAAMLGVSRKGFADRKKLALEDLKKLLQL